MTDSPFTTTDGAKAQSADLLAMRSPVRRKENKMGEFSKIEWCDHTFNPWIGCQEVSPACDNCYARVQNNFRHWVEGWGPHGERKRTSVSNWRKPISWDRAAGVAGKRARVFCASLADVFDNKAKPEWRQDLWGLIDRTPDLDWLLLTKRPENALKMTPETWVTWPKNIWLGITAENQTEFDRRWTIARDIPAAVHFVSYEPALGPLSIPFLDHTPDWIICGGESAKGTHRPMELAWARELRDQCKRYGAAFFMKQIDKVQPIPDDLMIRQFPTR